MARSAFGDVVPSSRTTYRTVTRRGTQVVLNHDALDATQMGIADGIGEMLTIARDDAAAHAPRDPELATRRGVPMMADTGRVAVYVDGKLVMGTGERTAAGNKPKGAKTPAGQVVGFLMFDSPVAHFAEQGTVKEAARPFMLTAFNRALPDAAQHILPAIGKRMKLGRFGSSVADAMGFKVGVEGGLQGMKR
jgi:hypothetical protein